MDGPGNRLVIFLQGCNLNCLSCHNPYTINLCDHCGECVTTCPEQALTLQQHTVVWDNSRCIQCDKCLESCHKNASPMVEYYSINSLMEIIEKNAMFLAGITISGGEATTQLPFIIQLFKQIKSHSTLKHLTCFIDSNGYLSPTGWQRVLPYTDGVMLDLKAWQPETALRLTGQSNQKVIESIQFIAHKEKLFELRLLHIPAQTDFLQYIDELSHFLIQLPESTRIKINAFQRHGVKGLASHWQAAQQAEIEHLAQQLQQRGIKNIITPCVYI